MKVHDICVQKNNLQLSYEIINALSNSSLSVKFAVAYIVEKLDTNLKSNTHTHWAHTRTSYVPNDTELQMLSKVCIRCEPDLYCTTFEETLYVDYRKDTVLNYIIYNRTDVPQNNCIK